MKALYKKELNYYLNNPIGYIIVILFAIFANFLYIKDIFVVGSGSMRPFFSAMPWLLMIVIPAFAMRSIAEEKRTHTLEILQSLPIGEKEIVLAKFSALLTLIFIGLLLTIGLPLSLLMLAKIYIPEIIVSYLGIVCMSGLFLSVSLFFSSKTKNQVVAFLGSVVVLFLLVVISSDFLSSVIPTSWSTYVSYLSPVYYLQQFLKGVIDIRAVSYFLSGTIFFLFLTIIDLEKKS